MSRISDVVNKIMQISGEMNTYGAIQNHTILSGMARDAGKLKKQGNF